MGPLAKFRKAETPTAEPKKKAERVREPRGPAVTPPMSLELRVEKCAARFVAKVSNIPSDQPYSGVEDMTVISRGFKKFVETTLFQAGIDWPMTTQRGHAAFWIMGGMLRFLKGRYPARKAEAACLLAASIAALLNPAVALPPEEPAEPGREGVAAERAEATVPPSPCE